MGLIVRFLRFFCFPFIRLLSISIFSSLFVCCLVKWISNIKYKNIERFTFMTWNSPEWKQFDVRRTRDRKGKRKAKENGRDEKSNFENEPFDSFSFLKKVKKDDWKEIFCHCNSVSFRKLYESSLNGTFENWQGK